MQKNAVFRFWTACTICLFIIFYNGSNMLSIKKEGVKIKNEEIIALPAQQIQTENVVKETESKQTETEPKTQQAEPTSAEAAKGNIIEKYISPYSAGLSYDGVYIKNSTDLNVDIASLLSEKLTFNIEKTQQPQVLIMHTHTTETFMSEDKSYYTESFSSRSRDNTKNMAKIGEIVANSLNSKGIITIHDTTQHDYPNYSGSYSRAANTICSYLEKYPSIKVVLDLHRDAVSSGESDKVKLVTEINGKKAAQVMLVMGSQSGSVTNFPNYKENLKLATRLQQTIEKKYPTLARPLMLMPKNYNQSLSNGSLLIEFGTDANTLSEACYSAELVGEALVDLFEGLKE